MRKTCAVLREHFGLKLSPGGLSQALERVADKLKPQYAQLGADLLEFPAVHVDETSWWLGGKSYWLWVFTHPEGTFYRVDPGRGRAVLVDVIGPQFPGVLVSDSLSVYDLQDGEQQKCYSHHLKAISAAMKLHPQQGRGFLADIQELLRDALALGRERVSAPPGLINKEIARLETRAESLLTEPSADHPNHPEEEKVRKRIAKQSDHLFTFLRHDGVDATNNLAERQLRPAVIARKISCGNKTERGAHTFEVLASIAATCTQIGSSFIDRVVEAVSVNSS
jgi:transposase